MQPLAQNWILQIFFMELAFSVLLIRKVENTEVALPLSFIFFDTSMLVTYCVVIANAGHLVRYIHDLDNMNWVVCLGVALHFIIVVGILFCFIGFVKQLRDISLLLEKLFQS